MKKLINIILIITMVFGLCSCKQTKQLEDDIYIFYTSDVHCGIEDNMTMSSLKALVDDTKAEHPYVALVDTGDYIQGGAIGMLSKGEIIIDVMNEMGYDVATFGNHEFDYGLDQLSKLMGMMKFQPTVCNIEYSGSKESIFKDVPKYVIKDFDGVKVAFIGVATPETVKDTNPSYYQEDGVYVYDFGGKEEGKQLAQRVQSTVDEVRKNGADYVVVLSHLGSADENVPCDSITLIGNTRGIDVVIDGHSHSVIVEDKYTNLDGEDVTLSSVGTKMEAIGQLIIGKDGSITTMHIQTYDKKNESIDSIIAEANNELNTILSQEISYTDHTIWMYDENGIRMARNRETPAGNFIADALRYETGADIGIVNGGGVRSGIPEGTITYQDLLNVCPFNNELVTVYATGQQIVDGLEYGANQTQAIYTLDEKPVGEFGTFMVVSGLKYTIDTSIESACLTDDNDMFIGYSSDARRVKDVYVLQDGEYVPIDLEKTYTVTGFDHTITNCGGGMTVFKDCEIVNTGALVDVEALIEYTKSLDSFTDKYVGVEGRITIE